MSKNLGTVLIGGGSGFIGTALKNLLKDKGYNTMLISRMPGPQRMTWNDLNRSGLPDHTTSIVNLAGQNVLDMTQRWNAGFKQNVYNSRINTTKSLADAIVKAIVKPKSFIMVTGVAIYEPHKTKVYDETSKTNEFDFLSKLCIDHEKAALLPDKKCRTVSIRSGVVLGRNGGMIKQLYLPFFFGLGGPISPGNQYLPWIHILDLIKLILFAIENEQVEGVLNGVAPQSITNIEFTKAFAEAMSRPALFPVPKFVLNILLSEERANMLTQGQKVHPKRVQSYGFQYEFPNIQSACKNIITT